METDQAFVEGAARPLRFLFTTFEGGGHVPPAILVARRLRERGHDVLFMSDEANRPAAATAGLTFRPWRRAPNRTTLGGRDEALDDWRRRWPPAVVRSVCDAVVCGPALAYARDTLDVLAAFSPDLVVSNELLFGVMAAAERFGAPLALLTANLWCFPTRADVPPFGPGFAPAATAFQKRREAGARRLIARWYDAGLRDLNRCRAALGLEPLTHTLDQLRAVSLTLLGASRAFDIDAAEAPAGFAYAGPLGEAPNWAGEMPAPTSLIDPGRPNVLVSFSTTYQGQERPIARCIAALAKLPVHGVVTLGPALEVARTPAALNVSVVRSASHDELVPRCDLVICHGGHGTLMRPLMAGVPVICLPMGRDHADNAERIARRGAGLRLTRDAGAGRIRAAVRAMLSDPGYRLQARRLGEAIAAEADGGLGAARALERLCIPEGRLDPGHRRGRTGA